MEPRPSTTPEPAPPSGPAGPVRPPPERERTAPRRLWADRGARWLVTAGGLTIIASILGILLFILIEVWPLTAGARVARSVALAQGEPPLAAVVVDEHRTHVAGLAADGVVRAFAMPGPGGGGREVAAVRVAPEGVRLEGLRATPDGLLTAVVDGGRVLAVPAGFRTRFEGSERRIEPEVGEPVYYELAPAGEEGELGAYSVRADREGGGTAAAQLAGGDLAVVRRAVRASFLGGEITESLERWRVPVSYRLSHLVFDGAGRNLYGGTPGGEVLWWRFGAGGPSDLQVVSSSPASRSRTRTPRSPGGPCSARSGTRATNEPEYVWQSTGGTDDFEPKLS
jgi:phosphate transport system permease protein